MQSCIHFHCLRFRCGRLQRIEPAIQIQFLIRMAANAARRAIHTDTAICSTSADAAFNGFERRSHFCFIVPVQKSFVSRQWLGVVADFWAFDSMRTPPQPIASHPERQLTQRLCPAIRIPRSKALCLQSPNPGASPHDHQKRQMDPPHGRTARHD
jgi:hypothetical protein